MKIALLQITSSDDPSQNLPMVQELMAEAAAEGAQFVLTPEVTNCVSFSRSHQNDVLALQDDDLVLAGLRQSALDLGLWLLIGSLALKTQDADGRYANRSFLISPQGKVVASYDKIHMFDVVVSENEAYRESSGYRPGDRAVVAQTAFGGVGMSICYDIRFAYLYRALAKAGAQILTIPAAFSLTTGRAHWESLLRARAIETGCYVLAPAQTGTHLASRGKPRQTYGHSMVISPWGEVVADGGTEAGIVYADLDMAEVEKARGRVPALNHDRPFEGP